MKKRISLLLALITVIAAMVLVLSFSASAAADPVHTTAATDGAYAEIYTSSGTVKATLSDVSSGVAAFFAKAGNGLRPTFQNPTASTHNQIFLDR